MNPDTTPTPTWKVCETFNSALLEDEKEGERLNEILCADKDEAECLVDLLNGKEIELAEKTNEVERLKELLAQAIHYPDCWDTACYETLDDALREMGSLKFFECTCDECPNKLAPAPEEPSK